MGCCGIESSGCKSSFELGHTLLAIVVPDTLEHIFVAVPFHKAILYIFVGVFDNIRVTFGWEKRRVKLSACRSTSE